MVVKAELSDLWCLQTARFSTTNSGMDFHRGSCPRCWNELRTNVHLLHSGGYFTYYWRFTPCLVAWDYHMSRYIFMKHMSVSKYNLSITSERVINPRCCVLTQPLNRSTALCWGGKFSCSQTSFLPHWEAPLVLCAPQVSVYQPLDRAD